MLQSPTHSSASSILSTFSSHTLISVCLSCRSTLSPDFKHFFRSQWNDSPRLLSTSSQNSYSPIISLMSFFPSYTALMRFGTTKFPGGQTKTVLAAFPSFRTRRRKPHFKFWLFLMQRIPIVSRLNFDNTKHGYKSIYNSESNGF